jgi:hypothetical protein
MSGVFQNIDPPPPHCPASVYTPPLVRGEDTLAGGRGGWGVNILEDARHSSVLYICNYFVLITMQQTERSETVLRFHEIMVRIRMWIRIRGSIPLTNGSRIRILLFRQ